MISKHLHGLAERRQHQALPNYRSLFTNRRGVIHAVMRRLTTGTRSEKCVVRRFRRCANVIECTYTNLDSIAY